MTAPVIPNKYDIVLPQGSVYKLVIAVTVAWLANLSGYSARGQIRADRSASSALLVDLASYLTVDVINSQIVLDMNADVLKTADWDRGQYDIELFVVGDTTKDIRVIQGTAFLNREVAR